MQWPDSDSYPARLNRTSAPCRDSPNSGN